MYCPFCRGYNGDFAVRCQHCGRVLTQAKQPADSRQPPRHTALTSILAATTLFSTVLAIGLAGLVTQRNLWPEIIGNPPVETPATLTASGGIAGQGPNASSEAISPRPAQPTSLDLGQLGIADHWRFVVNGASFTPDDTENGWWQSVVTYTLQNASDRTEKLDIPSTLSTQRSNARQPQSASSFLPLPSVPEKAPTASDSLRLFLVDGGQRRFGGGFGAGGDSYQVITAPGDTFRLTYRFRYPGTSPGPFVLRGAFMPGVHAGDFDVRLDRASPSPMRLVAPDNVVELSNDSWLTVGNEWAIASDGVEFGPGRGPGERPVTVHLRVMNLTSTPMPALTDRDDATGGLRDFYLSDESGDIAYTHADNQPRVVVPGHSTRSIMVQLYTQDLASTARPLTFTAVLNWQSNLYARFRVN